MATSFTLHEVKPKVIKLRLKIYLEGTLKCPCACYYCRPKVIVAASLTKSAGVFKCLSKATVLPLEKFFLLAAAAQLFRKRLITCRCWYTCFFFKHASPAEGCPAVTYSHTGRPRTTIGDASFHFRVRNGIGWYQCSMAAGQKSQCAYN